MYRMIRGISFTADGHIGDIVHGVLEAIAAPRYHWHIVPSQTEAMDSAFENDLFENEYCDGTALLHSNFHDSIIVFLKLEAYETECPAKDLPTYVEFAESDCQILLLINDCKYAEIYAKSPQALKKAESYLRKFPCSDILIITDENDKRTKLDVL